MADFCIPGVDPAAGVSLAEAIVLYGELEDPGRHWAVQRRVEPVYIIDEDALFRSPGAVVAHQSQKTPNDEEYGYETFYFKDSLNKLTRLTSDELRVYISKDDDAKKRVITKLIAGTLRATGFTCGAPPDLPPAAIDRARWRILVPDFKTSSGTSPGLALDGILIFSAKAPANERSMKAGRRPGPTTDCAAVMREKLSELGGMSQFDTKTRAHRAVLIALGVKSSKRGYTYQNFIKHAVR